MEAYVYRYFFNFSMWLFLEEGFFASAFPRKQHFGTRLIFMLVLHFSLGYEWVELVKRLPVEFGYLASNVYYFAIFTVSLGMLKFCFDIEWKDTLFIGTAGYAVQHITYAVICVLYSLQKICNWNLTVLLSHRQLHLYLFTGVLSYWILVRKQRRGGGMKKTDIRLTLITFAVLCSSVILSEAVYGANMNESAYIICRLYAILACLTSLLLQFELLARNRTETDRELLEQLLTLEYQRHEMSRETVDIINMKCHDLKYQLAALENMDSSEERRESIVQLQQAVMLYDDMVRTGNDTLDLILTEKSLLCRQRKISLSCMIDGAALSFLSTPDLSSLFGNALDNAIEAVTQVDEPHRVITLRVTKQHEMLLIHLDNYCPVKPRFADGLPVTTKADKHYHGFGTQSIRYIARRYNGELSMDWADQQFNLDILFPLPQTKDGASQ